MNKPSGACREVRATESPDSIFEPFRSSLRDRLPLARVERARRAGGHPLTLSINLSRGYPIVSLARGPAWSQAWLHRLWVKAGSPTGVAESERVAEAVLGEPESRQAPSLRAE